jgi:hypothetical protein
MQRHGLQRAQPLPLWLTAGASSHLLQVFHRKLCARKISPPYMPLPVSGKPRGQYRPVRTWLAVCNDHLLAADDDPQRQNIITGKDLTGSQSAKLCLFGAQQAVEP